MRFGIVGYGVEGRSTLEYLWRQGERDIVVMDHMGVDTLPYTVEQITGDAYLDGVFSCDIVFRTPGISPLHPVLQEANRRGIRVTSQCNEFFAQVPCPVIGVTGTKGKGTTSTLIYEILRANGKDAYLGGNIGTPPLSLLEHLTIDSFVVLELSSFQLMDCEHSPHIAVLLHIGEDHLDYHGSLEEYRMAKASLLRYQGAQDVYVFNQDYEELCNFAQSSVAQLIPCSTREILTVGVSIVNGVCTVSSQHQDTCPFMSVEEFGLLGTFNYENIAPAVAVAQHLQLLTEETRTVIREFRGLPHRLELVRTVDGVRFYDDSFSTVPATTLAAISAFPGQKKILILGGSSKQAHFDELLETLLLDTSVWGVILLGTAEAVHIKELLLAYNSVGEMQHRVVQMYTDVDHGQQTLHYILVPTVEELVGALREVMQYAEVVLLSPGCASFDLFTNYKERGMRFQHIVHAL